jgi:hypothetical protein
MNYKSQAMELRSKGLHSSSTFFADKLSFNAACTNLDDNNHAEQYKPAWWNTLCTPSHSLHLQQYEKL